MDMCNFHFIQCTLSASVPFNDNTKSDNDCDVFKTVAKSHLVSDYYIPS